MYDRILVPTDGSPEVDPVVEHAVELARVHDAELHAIYVVNTAGYASLPADSAIEGLGTMLNDQGEGALDRVEELASGVTVERVLVEGAPSKRIVEYAEREGCDLVVMGTHGRGGIDRLLLGSVAERVVRTSSVPVLTVRVEREEVDDADD
ncbi:universal stress protein [Halococcus sp. IIIV-5B]|uniref:universal stress protein n=1 Tax=Halococcus sp. IIIV-5B TaxID=2321230 RepID=UPI000E718BF6|nr:universal stress protein [Halococcus sp. IIIV-5B]RJT06474.1 universal stress protein [Halococcus sp. IIIV-5B]